MKEIKKKNHKILRNEFIFIRIFIFNVIIKF